VSPSEEPRSPTTSDVVSGFLRDAGVEVAFGYPGGPTIELMESARRLGIQTVLARREGTAAIMAEAHAMVSGSVGVCVSTLGPGSTALVPGVASAFMDRVPMIAISGQTSTRREPTFTHQVVDHNRLFASITKWTSRLTPETVATVMRKALRVAHAERPGSVHLTLNSDLAAATATDAEIRLPPLSHHAAVGRLSVRGDADPFRALREAARPVALVGTGAVRGDAGAVVAQLANEIGLPVVVSGMAKGIYPEDGPWFAGVLDMAANGVIWDLLESADLVLAIGFDPIELIKDWSPRCPLIHIDAVPNTDQVYPSDMELVGDIAHLLDALIHDGGSGERWSEAEVKDHRNRLQGVYYGGRREGVLNPTDVIDAVQEAVPAETIVTTDVGSHKLLVGQGWKTTEGRCLMTNGLSAMGFALPAAIAAKLARPDRPVVCTVGDGGLAMVQGELALASELSLGMIVTVFCDNSLNRIELKQKLKGYPSTATTMAPTRVATTAEAMGCDGVVVGSPAELQAALGDIGDIHALTRPLVIEARIDPAQYEAQY
jgi:acetolactate synthase-1/2/3 large subunit